MNQMKRPPHSRTLAFAQEIKGFPSCLARPSADCHFLGQPDDRPFLCGEAIRGLDRRIT
jgi:hypothetical protein